jgi:hypothetical protein
VNQESQEQSVIIREPETLTAQQVRAQVNLVQEVMKAVMRDKTHYGTIPGCGDKPSLLKPGAEKLASTFRLAVNPEITDLSTKDYIRYQIRASIIHQITGSFLGAGVGECSSNEEKYCWRNAVCKEEFDDTPEDRRRKKYKKNYGNIETVLQIRTNPADIANTVLKMAKKRALIDGILTVTGASDIFTQDIEDMPEELLNKKEVVPAKKQQDREIPPSGDFPDNPAINDEPKPSNPVISDPQRKRMYAISQKAGYSNDLFKELIQACGYSSSTEVQKKHYQTICEFIEGTPVDRCPQAFETIAAWCKDN